MNIVSTLDFFSGAHTGQGVPMLPMRQGLQRDANSPTPLEDPQRRISRAVWRLSKSIPNQVAAQTAPNGSWGRTTLSLPGMFIYLQNEATAQRTSAKTLGKMDKR